MDEILTGLKEEKSDQIINVSAEKPSKELSMEDEQNQTLNINEEIQKKRPKVSGGGAAEALIRGFAQPPLIQKIVTGYMMPLVEDHYVIKGKSKADKITDPPRRRWRTIAEKRQENRRIDKLKEEYAKEKGAVEHYPDFDNTTYKFRKHAQKYNRLLKEDFAGRFKQQLEDAGYDYDDVSYFIPLVRPKTQPAVVKKKPEQPKVKEKKNKYPTTPEDASEAKLFVTCMTENDMLREFQLGRLIEDTMSIHFTSAIASEDYMRDHYLNLRRQTEQCIRLPKVLQRFEDYWDKVDPEIKEIIDRQAKTAQVYKDMFAAYGVVHNVSLESGDFSRNGKLYKADYKRTREAYQRTLRDNYRYFGAIREKKRYAFTDEEHKKMNELAKKAKA